MSCPLFEQDRLRYFRTAFAARPSNLPAPLLPNMSSSRPAFDMARLPGTTIPEALPLHSSHIPFNNPSHSQRLHGSSSGSERGDTRVPQHSKASISGGSESSNVSSDNEGTPDSSPPSGGDDEQDLEGSDGTAEQDSRSDGFNAGPSGNEDLFISDISEGDEAESYAWFPLGRCPRRGSENQALWLACNNDILLGRADNGAVSR